MVERHVCQSGDRLKSLEEKMKTLEKALPETPLGDPDISGHRQYHDQRIAAARAEELFWHELKLDLAKKGTWAVLLILLGLVVAGIGVKTGVWK